MLTRAAAVLCCAPTLLWCHSSGCAGFCFTIYALSELVSAESDHVTMIPVLASNVVSMTAAITLLVAKWRYDRLEDNGGPTPPAVAHGTSARYSKFTDHDDAAADGGAASLSRLRADLGAHGSAPGSPYVSPPLTTVQTSVLSPATPHDSPAPSGRTGSFDFEDGVASSGFGDVQLADLALTRERRRSSGVGFSGGVDAAPGTSSAHSTVSAAHSMPAPARTASVSSPGGGELDP